MDTGQLIAGRYRLQEPVGAGGNAVIWRALDEKLNRVVALKRALAGDPARIRRLRREAEILARLNQPNVVTLLDVEPDGDGCWLIMEYVELRSLAEQGTLPPLRAAHIGAQIARALQAVHAAGIVHRDVKPGNVLVSDEDHAKLSDFGSSDVAEADVTVSDSTLIPGTPGYLAPEVADGESPTTASDVFSLGATLFAAIEGVSPYGPSDNPMALVRRAAARSVAPPRHAGPLTPVLSALMTADPARRPTAEQARQLLESVAGGRPVDVRATPVRRRRALRWAVPAGALVVIVAVLAWLLAGNVFGSPPSPTPTAAHSIAGPPPDVVGNPQTVDPCALVDPNPLARFGSTTVDNSYGNFNRCDVLLSQGDSRAHVKVEIDNTPPPSGQVQKVGAISVVRTPENNGQCDRTLALTDGNTIDVTAIQDAGAQFDLCAMADAATTTAVNAVSRGVIARRTNQIDPHSLFYVNACALLDSNALNLFPGVDALHPQPGFGNWTCEWQSTTNNESLQLIFDRSEPPTASDGLPLQLAGHAAFDEGNNYGDQSCEIVVVHRPFYDATDSQKDELLDVLVTGSLPSNQMCAQATALAAPAAAKLPAP